MIFNEDIMTFHFRKEVFSTNDARDIGELPQAKE